MEHRSTKYGTIEEATVQFMTQEICKSEGIVIIKSAYDDSVDVLRNINRMLKINKSDYEFAKQLIEKPVENRIEWLEEVVYNTLKSNQGGISVVEYQRISNLIEGLR